jgi:hypothetical protein
MSPTPRKKPYIQFALLLALVVVLCGGWLFWKANFTQLFLSSPAHPQIVFETSDHRLLGFSTPTRLNNKIINNTDTILFRWDMQTQRLESQQSLGGLFSSAEFSPDGKKMALRPSRSRNWIEIRNVDRPAQTVSRIDAKYLSYCWTPDSSQLIVFDEKAVLYDATTGQRLRNLDLQRWQKDVTDISRMTFSPDGHRVAVHESIDDLAKSPGPYHTMNNDGGYIKGRLFILSWPEFKLESQLPGDLWNICHWSQDGKRLTALTRILGGSTLLKAKLAHYDLASKETQWVDVEVPPGRKETYSASPYDNSFWQPAFSPDGRFLASARIPRSNGWSVWDTATGQWKGDIGAFKFWEEDFAPTHDRTRFSRDSRYLLREKPTGIERWDLKLLRR